MSEKGILAARLIDFATRHPAKFKMGHKVRVIAGPPAGWAFGIGTEAAISAAQVNGYTPHHWLYRMTALDSDKESMWYDEGCLEAM